MPITSKTPCFDALPDKHKAFVMFYVACLNASQAAKEAGYSERTAYSQGSRLLKDVNIAKAVAEKQKERFDAAELDADAILKRVGRVLQADARELTSLHHGACRYCWGVNHEYQWRTNREFNEAIKEAAQRDQKEPPTDEGGYGYSRTRKPNPECPECDGLGITYTMFADTDNLSDDALILFEGIKETKNGIEILTASKEKALDILAKHHGLLTAKVEVAADDALSSLIARVVAKGSAFPVATAKKKAKGNEGSQD